MVEKELAQEAQQEPEAPESKVEKRYVVISEEDLDNLIRNAGREGAKKGVEAYEKRRRKEKSWRISCGIAQRTLSSITAG